MLYVYLLEQIFYFGFDTVQLIFLLKNKKGTLYQKKKKKKKKKTEANLSKKRKCKKIGEKNWRLLYSDEQKKKKSGEN